MIKVEPKHLTVIKQLLKVYVPGIKVVAFGSRVNGNPEKYSDLDIAIIDESAIELSKLGTLKDAFAASDLPFIVDVLDWHAISPSFQKLIEKGSEVIQDQAPSKS